jgi:hypothetical protein
MTKLKPEYPVCCRDERLRLGHDVIIERDAESDRLLVQCVAGLHQGTWIIWNKSGKLERIGTEAWCRKIWPVAIPSA